MRDIKFRAWNGKEMIEPYSVRNGKCFVIRRCDLNEPVITGLDGANYYKNWDTEAGTEYPLMQFIDLKNYEGVDIYEGDILDEEGQLFVVVYDKEWAKFKLKSLMHIQYPEWNRGIKMKLVGNIHENSELLK